MSLELKKSKRLARSFEAQSCRSNCNIGATRNTSKGSDELEFELTQQWKSLFFYTENVLARETAHLVSHSSSPNSFYLFSFALYYAISSAIHMAYLWLCFILSSNLQVNTSR